jgi:D-alanyl-D-alanine carboxypeptidase
MATISSLNLNKMLPEPNVNGTVAYVIEDAQTGKRIAEQNPFILYTIASVQKLLPAFVADRVLGPNYRYETVVYENEETLHLLFGADPNLSKKEVK